ncbi:unnamed protein product, partial [Owenia fusiformis]
MLDIDELIQELCSCADQIEFHSLSSQTQGTEGYEENTGLTDGSADDTVQVVPTDCIRTIVDAHIKDAEDIVEDINTKEHQSNIEDLENVIDFSSAFSDDDDWQVNVKTPKTSINSDYSSVFFKTNNSPIVPSERINHDDTINDTVDEDYSGIFDFSTPTHDIINYTTTIEDFVNIENSKSTNIKYSVGDRNTSNTIIDFARIPEIEIKQEITNDSLQEDDNIEVGRDSEIIDSSHDEDTVVPDTDSQDTGKILEAILSDIKQTVDGADVDATDVDYPKSGEKPVPIKSEMKVEYYHSPIHNTISPSPSPISSLYSTPISCLQPSSSSSLHTIPSSSLHPTPNSSLHPTPNSSLHPTPSSSLHPTPSSSLHP